MPLTSPYQHVVEAELARIVDEGEGPEAPDGLTAARDRVEAALSRLKQARSLISELREDVDGLLEQAGDLAPAPSRSTFVTWSSRLHGAEELIEDVLSVDDSPDAEHALGGLPADLLDVERQYDKLLECEPEPDEGLAAVVVWALDAGADPLSIPWDAPARVREVARRAGLSRCTPRAPDNAIMRPDQNPSLALAPLSPAGTVAGVAMRRCHAHASSAEEEPPLPSLDRFSQTLRPYQQACIDDARGFVLASRALPPTTEAARRRRLYSMPTGTGKGSAELTLLRELRAGGLDAWIYTPSLEVLRGYLERCGGGPELETAGEDRLATLGERIFCTTPTRAQNRILRGERGVPQAVLYDEVHHATESNDVSGTLFALAPLAAWVGFTATPYRGTPRGTRELEQAWPDQVEVLTVPEAVTLGAWALPSFEVVGLVDDDEIKVVGGDFAAKAAGLLVGSRIEALAMLVRDRLQRDAGCNCSVPCDCPTRPWVPTAVTVPNTECASQLVEALDRLGVASRRVGQDTTARDRALAYLECREGRGVLVSVRVLAEGVDFPWLRRLVDARPTLSPVSWLQQLGRITRPGERRPEYICVCRNLERHAYLLQGLVPRKTIAEAQAAYPEPSKRGGSRALGLEQLTRFKPIDLPLAEGVRGVMYCLYQSDGNGTVTEWATLLDPTSERAVTARRTVETIVAGTGPGTGEKKWGRWTAAALPEDLAGHATSAFRGEISVKQAAWWARSALAHGLDPAARGIKQRQFACLPVLRDLGLTMAAQTAPGGDS